MKANTTIAGEARVIGRVGKLEKEPPGQLGGFLVSQAQRAAGDVPGLGTQPEISRGTKLSSPQFPV